MIVGRMGLVRPLKDAYPLRITADDNLRVAGSIGERVAEIIHVGHCAAIFKQSIAIEIKIETEIIGAGDRVIDAHGHPRKEKQVINHRIKIICRKRITVGINEANIRQVPARNRIKSGVVNIIRRDDHLEIVGGSVGDENVSNDLRLGRREGGFGGEPGGGAIRAGGGSITRTARDGDESDRHHQCHREHDQRDDEGDASAGRLKVEG